MFQWMSLRLSLPDGRALCAAGTNAAAKAINPGAVSRLAVAVVVSVFLPGRCRKDNLYGTTPLGFSRQMDWSIFLSTLTENRRLWQAVFYVDFYLKKSGLRNAGFGYV